MAYALASSNICTKWEHSETSINIVTNISNSKEKKRKKSYSSTVGGFSNQREI